MPTESWVVDGPRVIELEQVSAVRVGLVAGRVDVVAHDEPGVRLEVHAVDGRPLEVTLSDGELRVGYAFTLGGWEGFLETVRNFRGRDRADVHIAVPRDVAVRLGTVSADGLLAGVQEDCAVSTVSGSVVVDGTRGRLSAHTVSGEIAVRDHRGDLRINSVSGEVAASGQLVVVQANTVSGALTLDTGAQASSFTVSSVSGDGTVRLPLEKGLRATAHTVSGRLVVDGQEYKGTSPGQKSVDLSAGDGSCYLTANTVSGHVTVLRGVAATA